MSQSLRLLRQPLIRMALLIVVAFYGIFAPEARATSIFDFRVTICVADEQGKAIAGARVIIDGPTISQWLTKPEDGCVDEVRKLNLIKKYTLIVEAPGYEAYKEPLSLTEEPVLSKKITLKKVASAEKKTATGTQGDSASSDEDKQDTSEPGDRGIVSRWRGAVVEFVSNYRLPGLVFLTALALVWVGWRMGYRLDVYRLGEPAPTVAQEVKTILEAALSPMAFNVQLLKTDQEKIGRQQESILEKLDKIQSANRRPPAFEPELAEQSFSSVASQAKVTKQSHASDALLKMSSFQEMAQSAYRNLMQGIAVFPAPVYLNTEVNNSPMDMLGDSKVYLQEVGGLQGTFVLFKGADDHGCVFPNPSLKFRQQALKIVFPNLTEAQFGNDTENIRPVIVSRADGNRWKVEFTQ